MRGALSPVVVMKYLASRDTLRKRERFRQIRKRLQDASAYARKAMLDAKGQLNPGLMPRTLEDLAKIAPPANRSTPTAFPSGIASRKSGERT